MEGQIWLNDLPQFENYRLLSHFESNLLICRLQNQVQYFFYCSQSKYTKFSFDTGPVSISPNVPRLGDSGAPEAGKFQLKYKIKIEKQSVDLLDLAPLLPNRCCLQYFLFSRIANFVRSIRFREAEILRFIFLLNFVFRQFVVSKLFFSQVFCL